MNMLPHCGIRKAVEFKGEPDCAINTERIVGKRRGQNLPFPSRIRSGRRSEDGTKRIK